MNLIDNGVAEILWCERISTDTKCCFVVTFKDWYGNIRTKEVIDLVEFEKSTWVE